MKAPATNALLEGVTQEALLDVPIFPLPRTVLLPHTLMSLHVFEPRYRALMEYCLDGCHLMAIATLDEDAEPDDYDRPRIHPIAGVGRLKKSTKLPDGCFNIVLEGIGRVDVTREHSPTRPFRRVRAILLRDEPADEGVELDSAVFNLKTLAARALVKMGEEEAEIAKSMHQMEDAAYLADIVAAAAIEDHGDRQRVLSERSVLGRIQLVAALLSEILLNAETATQQNANFWGVKPGKA